MKRGVLVVSVLAVALAGVLLVTAGTGEGSGERQAERRVAETSPFAGTTWRLTSVENDGRVQRIDADLVASVQFDRSGELLGSDSVNAYSGRWRLAGGRLSLDATTTLVGYDGKDSGVRAATAGFESLVLEETKDTVVVERDGPDLVLRSATHRLTFRSDGPARPLPITPPASSRTP